jgi:electron transfer flavoprotein alpha subunit
MSALNDDIWVVAEHSDGVVQPVTYEVVALADKVASATGGKISVVVVGHPALPMAEQIAETTGFEAISLDAEAASCYSGETYRHLINRLAAAHTPRLLFIPHTTMGWDLAPGLAVDLGASSLSAVCGFAGDPEFVFQRRILNGKFLQEVRPVADRPAVVTVVPGTETPYVTTTSRPGEVRIYETEEAPTRTTVLGHVEPPASSVNLREAEVIIAAGRGVGDEENLACIRELAGLFRRSAVGASRPLCDAGVLPLACQVGMTGQTVSPRLYVACGISGALQHTMGMKNSDVVIAVNTDPNAMFCREAHYCVVADLHEFIPVLIEKIRGLRGKPPE